MKDEENKDEEMNKKQKEKNTKKKKNKKKKKKNYLVSTNVNKRRYKRIFRSQFIIPLKKKKNKNKKKNNNHPTNQPNQPTNLHTVQQSDSCTCMVDQKRSRRI